MALTRPRAYQIYDIDYKQAVRVVTTTNITLSGGAPSSVDGVSLSLNDRILVTGQSNGSQNGVYYITTLGSGSNGTWARSVDTNTTGELLSGTIIMVTEGVVYKDTQWKLITDDPITIGSTALTFVQNYSANSISSGTSNVSVQANSDVSIAVAGSNVAVFSLGVQNITGNIIPTANVTYNLGNATNRFNDLYLANNSIFLGNVTLAASSTELTVNGATVVTASGSSTLSLTGNITGGNLISNALVSAVTVTATGNVTGGNLNTGAQVVATGNVAGGNINTAGVVRATGDVFGKELWSTQSSGDEGGQVNLGIPAANTSLTGQVTIDVYQNQLRFFQADGARGAYIDLTQAAVGVGTNLLAGGGGGTPGGANTNVQFNDAGLFGGNAQFTYNKVTNLLTVGSISANTNGAGTNYAVGDDAYIGDINLVNTISIRGQQNAANAYIVFGNADSTALGRAGAGPLTYAGAFTATGNISGGNLSGTSITGTLTTAAQTNITSVGTLVSLAVTGNISGGNLSGTSIVGTLTTASQTNITSVGTLGSLTVTANVAGGNLTTAGQVVATGNVSGGNLIVSGNLVDTAAMEIITSANGNITLSPNGTGVIVANKDIRNGQANGVGNIGTTGGFFNTIFAKATSAQYADLAEMYVSDADYPPGTVVEFGGKYEITMSTHSHSTAVAGIVSTNPSYLMNSTQAGEHVLPIALTGRVPCRVQGPVRKGDVLVSALTPGVAQRIGMNWQPGCVVGKSMEVIESNEIQTIEVAVGRL